MAIQKLSTANGAGSTAPTAGRFAAVSGGTTSTYVSGGLTYQIQTFTASGTLTVANSGMVDVLVVGGGAGGGYGDASWPGGGGAGGSWGGVAGVGGVGGGGAGTNGGSPAATAGTTNTGGGGGGTRGAVTPGTGGSGTVFILIG